MQQNFDRLIQSPGPGPSTPSKPPFVTPVGMSLCLLFSGYLKVNNFTRAAREFESECRVNKKTMRDGMRNAQVKLNLRIKRIFT